jgi:peptide deformylase
MSTQVVFDPSKKEFKISTDVATNVATKDYEPLVVFTDKHPLLGQKLPLFDFQNPPMPPDEIVGRLKVTLKQYSGLGLAANQCGLPFRVFALSAGDDVLVCFNPRIKAVSETKSDFTEGCLSFPGLYLKVNRPHEIEVEFEIQNGTTHSAKFSGLTAHCFQHELDHLNGIKFTKYAGKTAIHMARKKQSKILKTYIRKKHQ